MRFVMSKKKVERLEAIGQIFLEHTKQPNVSKTMSRLYFAHKKIGMPLSFQVNKRFFRRLL